MLPWRTACGRWQLNLTPFFRANWDADFRAMLDALVAHLASASPLSNDTVTEARRIAAELRSGNGDVDQLQRLAELAVQWVIANPIPLAAPKYAR